MEKFKIKLHKEKFNFCSAHFITYNGHCENLHGHNYHVNAELTGRIGPDNYVLDFTVVKPLISEICNSLDHKVLLAVRNKNLRYNVGSKEIEVGFKERRYVFPLEDVIQLPIENTTAELLARYISNRLVTSLEEKKLIQGDNISSIQVEVEESSGQRAIYVAERF